MQPKVFVSYSWDNAKHKAWVRDLASRLRSDGVDARLDQWHLQPGDQLTEFMEKEVRENRFILIVCTRRYKQKSDKRKGGVGYEGDIITAEILNKRNRRKFIPLQRDGSWKLCAPSWLAASYSINLSGDPYSEDQYMALVDTIFGRSLIAPPIGSMPHKIQLLFEASDKYIENVLVNIPDQDVRFHSHNLYPAKYVRISIRNNSDKTLRGCAVYLVGVERMSDGKFVDVFHSAGMRLNWELEQGGGLDGEKVLHRSMSKYVDLFFTYNMPEQQGIRFRVFIQTYNFEHIWEIPGVYRLTVRAFAENVDSAELKIILTWNKKWDDFKISQEST